MTFHSSHPSVIAEATRPKHGLEVESPEPAPTPPVAMMRRMEVSFLLDSNTMCVEMHRRACMLANMGRGSLA